jgi:hypothetical protein
MADDLKHGYVCPEGPWNVETVLTHLTMLIESNDRRYEDRFAASQQAITLGFSAQKSAVDAALAAQSAAVIKAEVSTEKRFESVNEFRNTLADQQRNLMPRSEVEVIVRGLTDKIAAMEKAYDASQAERMGIKGGWGYAVGIVGFVLAILAVIGAMVTLAVRLIP